MSETIPEEGTQVLHIRYENGTLSRITLGEDVTTEIPMDAVVITPEEYATSLASLERAHEVMGEEMRAEEQEAVKTDYDALRAAGVPEATSRRLTGYTG